MLRKQNKTNGEKKETLKRRAALKKTEKVTSNLPNLRPVATNNFCAPLRDLLTENAEPAAKETPLVHLELMRVTER
jgi:hypothetical protein